MSHIIAVILIAVSFAIVAGAIVLRMKRRRISFEADFWGIFRCCLPRNDWDRRCMQADIDVIIGRMHSNENFKRARAIAKRAGFYVYADRVSYLSIVPDRLLDPRI